MMIKGKLKMDSTEKIIALDRKDRIHKFKKMKIVEYAVHRTSNSGRIQGEHFVLTRST